MNTNAPYRILIIDDNPIIHNDYRKILSAGKCPNPAVDVLEATLFEDLVPSRPIMTFEVESAFQGQEGLKLVEKSVLEGRPYALAFVDVRMPPGWDGVETAVQIWRACPELQIVICTAYSDYHWEDIVRQLGRLDSLLMLKKPFDNIEVQQMAHALCEKWRLAREIEAQTRDLEQKILERTAQLQAALGAGPNRNGTASAPTAAQS
ncbi:MAG: response regulator [Verrucomicrobiota bacterium]